MSKVRIGLISDTHIPEARQELWPQVFHVFDGVDFILHAGDIHDLKVIDQLCEVAPTYAARGNGDGHRYHRHVLQQYGSEVKRVRHPQKRRDGVCTVLAFGSRH